MSKTSKIKKTVIARGTIEANPDLAFDSDDDEEAGGCSR
jgi:hypothetical protein